MVSASHMQLNWFFPFKFQKVVPSIGPCSCLGPTIDIIRFAGWIFYSISWHPEGPGPGKRSKAFRQILAGVYWPISPESHILPESHANSCCFPHLLHSLSLYHHFFRHHERNATQVFHKFPQGQEEREWPS